MASFPPDGENMFDVEDYFSYNGAIPTKGDLPMDHEVCLEAQVETPLVVEAQITRSVLAALEAEDVGVPCMVGVCVTNDSPDQPGDTGG